MIRWAMFYNGQVYEMFNSLYTMLVAVYAFHLLLKSSINPRLIAAG